MGKQKKIVLFLLCIIIISVVSLTTANYTYAPDTQAQNDVNLLDQRTLLTDDFIKATWSDLPTAKELMELPICFCVDSRDYSDKAEFNSIIQNCTCNGINGYTGSWIFNQPHIWLQYDETTWVLVPSTYFKNNSSD
ncbi:MAG: hypothetical protein ACQCN3_00375 [Candidatus Bathyarchaeia archaeon]|jgi:hypothetical protein